ncbi:hypothetical protein [Bacillus ndiopicus]|uniref:hypothetical protein n=1 Tax=Bacillus ndiopicus TaxID=1347368 RepID=UPI0005AAED7C|nr:hypothetical protein [Bacillus ndiopicus]
MKTLVKVLEGSFPVRYDGVVYREGDELEVLSEHAEHASFEILKEANLPKKRSSKVTGEQGE